MVNEFYGCAVGDISGGIGVKKKAMLLIFYCASATQKNVTSFNFTSFVIQNRSSISLHFCTHFEDITNFIEANISLILKQYKSHKENITSCHW